MTDRTVNVAARLSITARQNPAGLAVVEPAQGTAGGRAAYRHVTFQQLDQDSDLLADGLRSLGVQSGLRIVLMVRPGIDFIALVFALFKAGVVTVLIDPGMGRSSLLRCLEEVEPDGFVALPLVHAIRIALRSRFPKARYNVTVGRRWFWGGPTIRQLRARTLGRDFRPAATTADDPAAIIFTTGSTGPPKGVLYRHGNFDEQVDELRDFYQIQPGEIDLAAFPLFGLFNCAMGVSTIVPDMDPTRPAFVDPRKIVQAVQDWQATQAFGSPALWNVVGRYCEEHQLQLPSLRRVLSAGAPVPPHVLRRMKNAIPTEGDVHTPYGATESLPVASISATEVLGETADRSAHGAGTCVGRRFPGIRWKVIRIDDGPIAKLDLAEELPLGQIGELIVSGPVVTRQYVTRVEANALHKIQDGDTVWHRLGDLGYLDEQDRFWFCGRKAHRVLTPQGPMYTLPCEAIFNQHPSVYRAALVGVGTPGHQRPIIIVETWPACRPRSEQEQTCLLADLRQLAAGNPLTQQILDIFIHPSLPVDIRHNAKIFREQLAVWAETQLRRGLARNLAKC
jgi:acyl-CoA synthetase (AMP-forming)/AMP-acid ligase II